jgi:hypothetical protein
MPLTAPPWTGKADILLLEGVAELDAQRVLLFGKLLG